MQNLKVVFVAEKFACYNLGITARKQTMRKSYLALITIMPLLACTPASNTQSGNQNNTGSVTVDSTAKDITQVFFAKLRKPTRMFWAALRGRQIRPSKKAAWADRQVEISPPASPAVNHKSRHRIV